jgi:cysteine desulfurase
METIYLDYNSATPLAGAARQAMLPFLDEFSANVGNPHWQSRAVEEAIEDTRSSVAMMLGSNASEIVFTSGEIESANIALLGAVKAFESSRKRRVKGHVILSALEHAAIRHIADQVKKIGWDVDYVPCSPGCRIEAERLAAAIRKNTVAISIQLANGQLGSIQNLAELTAVPRPEGCVFHTDASQAVGKLDFDVHDLGVDLLSIGSHTMYGPSGVGALFIRSGTPLEPIFFGGWEENGLRPGRMSPILLAGFGAAAQLVKAGSSESGERLRELRDLFESNFDEVLDGDWRSIAELGGESRLPNTIPMRLRGVDATKLVQQIPELHIGLPFPNSMISAQSVLNSPWNAIGITGDSAKELAVVSVGWNTTREEVKRAAGLLAEAYRHAPRG